MFNKVKNFAANCGKKLKGAALAVVGTVAAAGSMVSEKAMAAVDVTAVNTALTGAETDAHSVAATVIAIVAGLVVVGVIIGIVRKV